MRLVLRCDASPAIGSGHVMRCLVLADAWRARGARCVFIGCGWPAALVAQVQAAGHQVCQWPAPSDPGEAVAPWHVPDWAADAHAGMQAVIEVWGNPSQPDAELCDWLVVDHYGLDARWEALWRSRAGHILVIDDLADRPHVADMLLDQNLRADQGAAYAACLPDMARRLCGVDYALLRPEFAGWRRQLAQGADGLSARDGVVRRILVFMGGGDADNVTALAVSAIQLLPEEVQRPLMVDIVIGAAHPQRQAWEDWSRECPGYALHVQTADMAALMARADLAIGAGGVANWERAALGLPSVAIGVADNQRPILRLLAEQGRVLALPDHRQVSPELLAAVLRGVLAMPAVLRGLGLRLGELVDGLGCERVVDAMAALAAPEAEAMSSLVLRPVTVADARPLWEWRNAPEVRAASRQSAPIDWRDHCTWLVGVLNDPDRHLLCAHADGQPVGVLRYDRGQPPAMLAASACDVSWWEVSIYLGPGRQGQGWGSRLLRAGSAWLRAQGYAGDRLWAQVHRDNPASLRCFLKSGFTDAGLACEGEWRCFKMQL